MTCTEEYREHIEYTFHAFCKVVIRNATINAAWIRSRKHKRKISLEYLTDEKHYPLGTTDEYFQATEADVSGKLEALQRLTGQFSMPEDGEFTTEDIDKYVTGVRIYI